MQKHVIKRVLLNSFWLSVLLHLLLLLSMTTVIIFQPKEQKKLPNLYVPSYVYKGQIKPARALAKISTPAPAPPPSTPSKENQEQAELSNSPPTQESVPKKSIMAATRSVLQQYQQEALNTPSEEDPIYLVGDENGVADPLIKLMGRALSAHFSYPPTAGELGIKGRVIVGLTLHPEGHFTQVQIIRSSDNPDLDAAALYAVNSAPRVVGADRFLSQPKHFVVGFIFR